jgi:FMN phosphatase YigB (HAD superfamily)
MYKLRTLDVWDTLLRRDCHPECIKVIVAHHVFLRYADQLTPRYDDHWSVYRARLEVEQALAEESLTKGGDGEYDVSEVVDCWLRMIAPDLALADSVSEIVEYEFQIEVACTTPDDDVNAVLQAHPAERTVFVSDFYWPTEMLVRLLRAKGLEPVVAEGLCSCDVGLNKRSGRLFQYVLRKYGVEPSAVVHIGDNPYSDVAAAEANGIRAVHFQPSRAHEERLDREKLFACRDQLFVEAAEQARIACEKHLGGRNDGQAAAFRFGVDQAPLFAGFALFIAERAVLDQVERLFFLMREGEFLHRVFQAVHADGSYRGHALPESALLSVSRASTFSATVQDPAMEFLSRGRWPYRGHRLCSLVDALGVDTADLGQALADSKLKLDEVIADVTSDSRMRVFLEHPALRWAARHAGAAARERLTAYLRSRGFAEGGRYAVVDVGWRGTIQSNLACLGLATRLHGYYLALQQPLLPASDGCEMAAYAIDESRSTRNVDLLETSGVIEMLCAAGIGSTTGYRYEGGAVVPIHSDSNDECPGYADVVRHFQDGAVLGCRVWAPLIARYGCGASDVAPPALAAWRALADSPDQVIVDAFGETILDDPHARNRFIKPKEVPGVAAMAAACWNRRAWRDLRDYLRRIRWRRAVQPSSTRSTIGHRIVGILLSLASFYRRMQRRLRGGRAGAAAPKLRT